LKKINEKKPNCIFFSKFVAKFKLKKKLEDKLDIFEQKYEPKK